jgi:DNA replication licensing factor MCM5
MREEDRVAIHEAMEQQTISIAKAGITTILNSRSSVLAAANPHFGRYDDLKTASENIDFQSTILSRFDLIFIVRDVRNVERDMNIANHVIRLHMTGATETQENELSIAWTKRFVSYCRNSCAPRLSPEAAEVLKGMYVKFRQEHGRTEASKKRIPITVRQLEAVIRISESLAKMSLSPVATEEHVQEAYRLFKISTLDAANAGVSSEETDESVKQAEEWIRSRLPRGHRTSYANLLNEMTSVQKYEENVAVRAITNLKRKRVLQGKNQDKIIQRSNEVH